MSWVGLSNYITLLTDERFWNSAMRTMAFTVTGITLSFLIGLGLALALRGDVRGKSVFRTLYTLPLFVAPVIVGFGWRFMYNSYVGVIGAYLLPKIFGLPVETILGDPSIALFATIVADVWNRTPLVFLILLAGLEAISPEYYESAMIDGASSWGMFRHISLPQLKFPILVALLFRFIGAINMFDTIYVMTYGGPGDATETMVIYGQKIAFYYFRMGLGSAFAILVLFVVIASSSLFIRYLTR